MLCRTAFYWCISLLWMVLFQPEFWCLFVFFFSSWATLTKVVVWTDKASVLTVYPQQNFVPFPLFLFWLFLWQNLTLCNIEMFYMVTCTKCDKVSLLFPRRRLYLIFSLLFSSFFFFVLFCTAVRFTLAGFNTSHTSPNCPLIILDFRLLTCVSIGEADIPGLFWLLLNVVISDPVIPWVLR